MMRQKQIQKEEKITKSWSKIAQDWKNTVTPPMAPSADDIKTYEYWLKERLKNSHSINILILGSTPEIRKMVAKYPLAKPMICDINLDFYLAMSELTENTADNEIFLKSEWSKAPLKGKYFDLIIGDGIIANVAIKNKKIFLKNMTQALKLDGLMVIREMFMDEGRLVNTDEVLKQFEKFPLNPRSLMDLLISLEYSVYKIKTKKVIMPQIKKNLEKYFDKKTHQYQYPNQKVQKLLNDPRLEKWLNLDKEWDVNLYADTKKLIEEYFIIKDFVHSKDHLKNPCCQIFGHIMPIWTLAQKI